MIFGTLKYSRNKGNKDSNLIITLSCLIPYTDNRVYYKAGD